jgi:glutamate formiminotransferase
MMLLVLIECVPNFSEGRRPEIIEAIVASMRAIQGIKVWTSERSRS